MRPPCQVRPQSPALRLWQKQSRTLPAECLSSAAASGCTWYQGSPEASHLVGYNMRNSTQGTSTSKWPMTNSRFCRRNILNLEWLWPQAIFQDLGQEVCAGKKSSNKETLNKGCLVCIKVFVRWVECVLQQLMGLMVHSVTFHADVLSASIESMKQLSSSGIERYSSFLLSTTPKIILKDLKRVGSPLSIVACSTN